MSTNRLCLFFPPSFSWGFLKPTPERSGAPSHPGSCGPGRQEGGGLHMLAIVTPMRFFHCSHRCHRTALANLFLISLMASKHKNQSAASFRRIHNANI